MSMALRVIFSVSQMWNLFGSFTEPFNSCEPYEARKTNQSSSNPTTNKGRHDELKLQKLFVTLENQRQSCLLNHIFRSKQAPMEQM